MTAGRSPGNGRTWRRRLRPAALLFVCVVAPAALVMAPARDQTRPEPPAGALPADALAAERPSTSRPRRHHQAGARQLVDVIDRDAPTPQRITIPAIGVSAHIVPLRLEPGGTMQTPDNCGKAGWYEPGREPGERGPAVITGHVDSMNGPAVFYRLRELRRGNLIYIRRADGSTVRFRVEGLERWPKETFPTHRVFAATRVAALRLVTCSGDFDGVVGSLPDNTIVCAARVPVEHSLD